MAGRIRDYLPAPFKALKRVLPKAFMGRSMLIIVTPIIMIQAITAYVFFDRHWSKVTDLLAENIAGDIAAMIDYTYHVPVYRTNDIQTLAQNRFGLNVTFAPASVHYSSNVFKAPDWKDNILNRALRKKISEPFKLAVQGEEIYIDVSTLRGMIHITTQTKRLFPKTTPILIWWALGAPLFFITIAVFFMRNQIRPLRKLATAVTNFGMGREINEYKPYGASEIRLVGQAFQDMQERIKKQIKQRTEMLAGVSHDLRTPLTRMQLQLALMEESPEHQDLLNDVKEMQKMVEEYLSFAKGEEGELSTQIDINALFNDLVRSFNNASVHYEDLSTELTIYAKPHAIKRCLNNIISNATKYAQNVWIYLLDNPTDIKIHIDDDGPGIPIDQRKEVFRPFYRIDDSRNTETGGYGLGLAISRDIVHSHGGNITLNDSPHGGLRVTLVLPK